MQISQLCHDTEELDRSRQWYIQMVTFSYELDLPYVFKSEWISLVNIAAAKMIGYVVDKKVVSV